MINKIAVTGMACRFPGAKNVEEYWNNLVQGKDTIKHFTEKELINSEFDYNNLRKNPDYVKARGIIDDIDLFDEFFFGMTPKEAAETDPQHRIWLETSWESFESAGIDPINFPGAIGVFAGGYMSTYLMNNILRDQKKLENYIRLRTIESYHLLTSNDTSFIATKTAYKYNLRGPAVYIHTACSTSLVAIIQACQSLYSYESDVCLAGGICISVPQETGYIYQEGAIPSPDGYCRPFDANANGTVASNGVGAVILKRLDDAIRDRDTIYAVISGWAINNDGCNKVSYTAPSIEGQAEAIAMAQSFAEVHPEDISYIEAHGTATNLGDPIEIAALTKIFSAKTDKKQFCGIGSVKSNIGHTDAAAGVAGFIKACLASYYKTIPPSLHYFEPNPNIDFKNSPFYVQKELRRWEEERPLIMGVSSFGIGGTNAHVIVEQAPSQNQTDILNTEWPSLILLSAKSEYSLKRRKEDIIDFIKTKSAININNLAYTLISGRNHMTYRSFIIASDVKELTAGENFFTDGKTNELASKIVFMFPGQGSQYVSMGRDLYNSNILFRNILDNGFEIVEFETGVNLKSILFESTNISETEKKLFRTDMTQPALFIIEYALARIFMQFNVNPSYLIGHSIGEYVAACLAGVFDMTTALKIVIKRGQLMSKMPEGSMMAVSTGCEHLKNIDNQYFEISADNSSSFSTISFKRENTSIIKKLLDKNNIHYVPLNTSHAFHSSDFDPILEEFAKYVNQFTLSHPYLPIVSCMTGDFITAEQVTSGSYWALQLRKTVQFRKGISRLAENEEIVFLEVGPGTHLSSLVRKNEDVKNKNLIIPTLGKYNKIDERNKILTALGNLFLIGTKFDSEILFKDTLPIKISLPTYPFERKRHWIDFKLQEKPHVNVPLCNSFTELCDLNDSKTDGEELNLNIPSMNEEKYSIKELTPTEQIIFKIWSETFMNMNVSVTDNFFKIGGDSLQAIIVISKIKTKFNIDLPLKAFLDNPVIKDLALIIDKLK